MGGVTKRVCGWEDGTYVFLDGFESKTIIDSVFASPFESGLEFGDTICSVPSCGPKESGTNGEQSERGGRVFACA